MAHVVGFQGRHLGFDLHLDIVRQAVLQDDHDVDVGAFEHLAAGGMLARLVMREEISKVARDEGADLAAHFA